MDRGDLGVVGIVSGCFWSLLKLGRVLSGMFYLVVGR